MQEEKDYEKLYKDLLVKYEKLAVKSVHFSSPDNLCTAFKTIVDKETRDTNNCNSFNLPIVEPIWFHNAMKLQESLSSYFSACTNKNNNNKNEIKNKNQNKNQNKNDDHNETTINTQPHIARLNYTQYKSQEFSQRSKERHTSEMGRIIKYKCCNNEYWMGKLKEVITVHWGRNSGNGFLCLPKFSGMDTDYLQIVLDARDKNWHLFLSECKRIQGWHPFASKRVTDDIRKLKRARTAEVCRAMLQTGKGKGKSRTDYDLISKDECSAFFVFIMNDCESISICIDSDINGNKFRIPFVVSNHSPRTILSQISGDKQTGYGYSESHCTLTTMISPMSAQRSIPSVLICGDFADERRSHQHIFSKVDKEFEYDKSSCIKALGDFPVVISFVLFRVNPNTRKLTSRMGRSTVAIWDIGMKRKCNDIIGDESKVEEEKDIIQLCNNQFTNNKYKSHIYYESQIKKERKNKNKNQNKNDNNNNNNNNSSKNKNNKKNIVKWMDALSMYLPNLSKLPTV